MFVVKWSHYFLCVKLVTFLMPKSCGGNIFVVYITNAPGAELCKARIVIFKDRIRVRMHFSFRSEVLRVCNSREGTA